MKKIFFLFFFPFSAVAYNAEAQNGNTVCGWKQFNSDFRLMKKNNEVFQKQQLHLAEIADKNTLYTLPVVVHVIHTGDAIGSPDNPTDAKINAMIKLLNNAYHKKGASFGGADMKIQFKLAVKAPGCTATTGINRIDGSSVPNYVSGGITNNNYAGSADEISVKNLSRWPNTDYINIWIVNKINGSTTFPGGYAYFPEYNSALTDGLVLQASVVNGTNKTIVHEMGHFFSLYHPFHDGGYETTCANNSNCNVDGDRVCDTEVELNVACGTSTNTCNNNLPFVIADSTKNYTVLNNFMGYTDCQWMFTEGQKTRARSALLSFRYGLITSKALTAPDSLSPFIACLPTATYGLSPYYGVQKVEFNTLSVYSNSSQADGSFYIDRTCNQSTTVIQGKAYTLTVTGSYGNPHRIKVFIDYNNDGDFADANETVLSAYTDTAKKKITIPSTGVVTGVPLRMRVIADNPALPAPSACQLHGTVTDGAGQVEDYSIVVATILFSKNKKQNSSEQDRITAIAKK